MSTESDTTTTTNTLTNDLTNPVSDAEAKEKIAEAMMEQYIERPKNAVPVVVTTEYRGIFFGYAVRLLDTNGDPVEKIVLWGCRNCIFFSADMKGFLGLVERGPSENCKIGPASPLTGLQKVTSINRVSPEAAARWEAAPWSTE